MQKFITVNCILFIIVLGACHNSGKEVLTKQVDNEIQFFPVTDFLLGQLNETDSLPITPLKITINGNKQDSLWLRKENIREFAFPFLHPVIDSASMSNYFTEKSFFDQTINAVTFSYDLKRPMPDSMKLNHWDVYLDPQKNTVRRIYLVKAEIVNKQNITTQLTWKVGKWCSIRTIVQQQNKDPQVREEIMKWNFDE